MLPDYYNEIDEYAAQWLRNLIDAGLIPPGIVDTRSIVDVQPGDIAGFRRCHFFAGLGGWPRALHLAGWPDDRPVWTGSCPCQPFSAAGTGAGFSDERHLWPAWHHLIRERRPSVVFGEQVASKDGLGWLDLVQADLEGSGYACGAVDLCAAGIGAPHIRQRQWWIGERLADADGGHPGAEGLQRSREHGQQPQDSVADWLVHGLGSRLEGHGGRPGAAPGHGEGAVRPAPPSGEPCRLADDALGGRREERANAGWLVAGDRAQRFAAGLGASGGDLRPGPTNGLWRDADWLFCRDGKWRPVEPGTFPLLDGLSRQLVRLRAVEALGLEEVSKYASSCNSDPRQILRMVQHAICSQTGWEEQSIGVCQQLHEAQVLFDYLLCLEAACHGTAERSGFEKASAEVRSRIMRGMREPGTSRCSPRGWQSVEQFGGKSPDALLALSLILARHAEAHREVARSAHAASARVGMLRGFGNAIVPQVAAEFIRAYLECRP